jgi:hypothetical protein
MKERVRSGVRWFALVIVVAAPAVASWRGLVGFGVQTLGLSGGWQFVVPLVLDGAALYSAALALRAVLTGDSALGARLLTVVYALSSASFNGYHALTHDGAAAALFFAGASVSAVVLWDATLRMTRRDQLRDMGMVEGPLPRFRPLRWLVAPVETSRAWRVAVIEGISDPTQALNEVRTRRLPAGAAVRTEIEHGNDNENEGDESNVEQRIDREGRGLRGDADRGTGVPVDHHDADQGPRGHGAHGRDRRGLVRPGVLSNGNLLQHAAEQHVDAPVELAGLSKADAVRAAFDALGKRDIPAALAWCHARGVSVDRSYAYTVTWSPKLRVVNHHDPVAP